MLNQYQAIAVRNNKKDIKIKYKTNTNPSELLIMHNQDALDIIQALSEGINPFSAERLPEDSLCLHEAVNKALTTAVTALENQIKADARRASQPAKAGEPWSSEEEELLTNAFNRGDTITFIAEQFERSRGSIKARLVKLGLIEES